MRNKVSISFFMALALLFAFSAEAKPPKWAKKLPKAGNSTFRYYVASSEGRTRDEARAKVYQMVKNNIAESMGMASDINVSDQSTIDPATGNMKIETNNTVDGSSSIRIPMQKVCEKEEKLKDGLFRIYQLYQIAVSGNIQVQFDTFYNCN